MQAHGFRYCFTPLPAVLFTFPSRYLSTIGLPGVLSLGGWCRLLRTGFLRPRPTQVPARVGARFAYGAVTRSGPPFQASSATRSSSTHCRPYNPARASTPAVWALPLSLAATRGVTVVFLSSDYLDVSVRRVGNLIKVDRPPAGRVSPFGHPRITGRSRLPAAFRSLPRPSSPPGAKASPVRPLVLVAYQYACPAASRRGTLRVSSLSILELVFVFPSILSKNLCPPSPGGEVESKGFEPLTPSLQSWCSSQLS